MATEQITVTASQTSDFVALVPRLLGFQPQDSVVVVPFVGTRSVGAMRVDLPDAAHAIECAHSIAGLMCKLADLTGAAVIVYGDRERADIIGQALKLEAGKTGIALVEALYVINEGWGYIGDERPPIPMADVPADIAALPMEADQRSGAALPAVDAAYASAVAERVTAGIDHLDSFDLVSCFDAALTCDPACLTADSAGEMLWLLNQPSMRDVGLIHWSHGRGAEALEAQEAWQNGASYPDYLAAIMWGDAVRPDVTRLQSALQLCRHLAGAAPEHYRVGPLSTAAWLSWALGKSTHASVYASQALTIDPAHGLSEIVASFVQAGHLPEWATAR